MAIFIPTEKDKGMLEWVVREVRQLSVNDPVSRDGLIRTQQASDVYIALPPAEGIPALTVADEDTGTGEETLGAGDQPGSALCNIYHIAKGTGELHPLPDYPQLVYNLTTTALSQGWILVVKTKHGQWIAVTGGGGGDACAGLEQLPNYSAAQTQIVSHIAGGSCEWMDVIECVEDGTGTGS